MDELLPLPPKSLGVHAIIAFRWSLQYLSVRISGHHFPELSEQYFRHHLLHRAGRDIMEGKRLADFSDAVRESTLKRLTVVPERCANWRIDKDSMSFADIARHLIDSDNYLFKMLETKDCPRIVGVSDPAEIKSHDEYLRLIDELKRTQEMRRALLESMSDEAFSETMYDERFGEVSAWWVVVRGNLDHEIHHRGQIIAYLKLAK
jgi:uncharacterized damage-inducible protein DinB